MMGCSHNFILTATLLCDMCYIPLWVNPARINQSPTLHEI